MAFVLLSSYSCFAQPLRSAQNSRVARVVLLEERGVPRRDDGSSARMIYFTNPLFGDVDLFVLDDSFAV